jgi:hypothetical protein
MWYTRRGGENGELKMWYTRRGGENGELKTEHQLPTEELSRGAALAYASGCDLRPPTSDFCPSGLWPLALRPLASNTGRLTPGRSPYCPKVPRFFFREPFRSRGDKTRNRSTAMSYGDGAKGTKRMCPKRVGLFLKHTLKTLGFLRWKNACAVK